MEPIIGLGFVVALPLWYVWSIIGGIATKDAPKLQLSAIVISVVLAVATAITAVWAIGLSRSDWRSMGYFLVPGEAAFAGYLVLVFNRWRRDSILYRKVLAWFALLFSMLTVVYNVAHGFQNISENRAYDAYDEAHFGQFFRDDEYIRAGLQQNAGRKAIWLDSVIRARPRDTVFQSAALRYDFKSPQLLDTLSRSSSPRVALSAILNTGTAAKTLAESYEKHSDSEPFASALAHNEKTPPDVFRRIYARHRGQPGVEVALASNPVVPRDVLFALADSASYPETISFLVQNPALDCDLLKEVARHLAGRGKSLATDYVVARMNEAWPRVCGG